MTLANPWLLVGLAAIAIPLWLHLVFREEEQGVPFPSLMFIRRIPFEVRRRKRLRDRALLALRALAVALLALAFAAPEFAAAPPPLPAAGGDRDTVLLLDRSYSMAAPDRWSALQRAAAGRIAAAGSGDRIALVAFAERAELLAPFTGDPAALRTPLEQLRPGAAGTRLAEALALAGQLLRSSTAASRRIVLVSDLQRSALDGIDRLFIDAAVQLEIDPVNDRVGGNLAVIDARLVRPEAPGPSRDLLEVTLQNTGNEPVGAQPWRLEIAGDTVHRAALSLAPGETRSELLPVVLAADRATPARIVLGDDALAGDNVHHLVLRPDPAIRVGLLLDGGGTDDPALFLRQALQVADAPAMAGARPTGQDGSLAPFTVLVADLATLDDAGRLAAIERHVAAGAGLLVIMAGEPRPIADTPLLPGGLGDRVDYPPPGVGVVVAPALEGGPWRDGGADLAAALADTRLVRAHRVAVDPRAAGDRVLAHLADGAPWLIERRHGLGSVVLMTTGLTGAWGNLVVEPGFVPLLHELVRYLARRPAPSIAVETGTVIALATRAGELPGGADWSRYLADGGHLVIELPGGGRRQLPSGEQLFRVEAPGTYEAHRADGAPPSLPLAVNVNRRESLLESGPAAALEQRLVRRPLPPPETRARHAAAAERRPLGWYLLLTVLLLLGLESFAARRTSLLPETTPAVAGGSQPDGYAR